jgi:hypothetical protein
MGKRLEAMNWRRFGRKYYPGICVERVRKILKTLSQGNRVPVEIQT